MTTITTPINEAKVKVWRERQQDTGWGHAFGHLIGIYTLIYAINRRTITPALYSIIGPLACAFALGFVGAMFNPNLADDEEAAERLGVLAVLVSTPVFAKQGIERARKHAELKLSQVGED